MGGLFVVSLRPVTLSLDFTRILFACVFLLRMDFVRPGGNVPPKEFPAYENQEAVSILAQSQNNFTRDLYLALAAQKTGNLFFSPFSIMAAVGMTHVGAREKTLEEIQSALHLPKDSKTVNEGFHNILSDLKIEVPEYELRTSNMVYISDKLSVLPEFSTILTEQYLSESKKVDFGNSAAVRKDINDKVEKDTNSRIKDLIPEGLLDSLTRMVLVNAVYFKGLWETQFKETDTYNEKFWVSNNQSVDVPMMHAKDNFRLFKHQELGAMLLAMDYQGSRLSMVIVLPDKRDGLAEVEAKLANIDFKALDSKMHSMKVEVTIPKFKLEEQLNLVDTLRGMGVKDLFNDTKSNLSGITDKENLYVSAVVHKAFLEVNEKGSEAAAATGVAVNTRCLIRPIPPFVADHPFLFLIRDRHFGLVLFAGKYVEPEK